jgi:hypothetical protein
MLVKKDSVTTAITASSSSLNEVVCFYQALLHCPQQLAGLRLLVRDTSSCWALCQLHLCFASPGGAWFAVLAGCRCRHGASS